MDIDTVFRRARGAFGNAVVWGVGWLTIGLVVPLVLQTMNFLSGSGFVPWNVLLDDALLTAFLGGAAAGGSMKLAQLADVLPPGHIQDEFDSSGAVDRLALEEEPTRRQ